MIVRTRWSIRSFLYYTWRINLVILTVTGATSLVYLQWLKSYLEIPPLIVAVLGTAMAFFIGFINNQAYDRWWEARKIWGSLLNDSRSWSRSVLTYLDQPDAALRGQQERMVRRQLAFLYALVAALRQTGDKTYQGYLSTDEQTRVLPMASVPTAILLIQAEDVQSLHRQALLDGFQFQRLDKLLEQFTTYMGQAERIKNTTFPISYTYFTQLFIWVFVILCTIIVADLLGYWSALLTWLIGFVYVVTYANGQFIMNPFENARNDTPMNTLVRTVEINLLQDLGEMDIPPPLTPINGDYLL